MSGNHMIFNENRGVHEFFSLNIERWWHRFASWMKHLKQATMMKMKIGKHLDDTPVASVITAVGSALNPLPPSGFKVRRCNGDIVTRYAPSYLSRIAEKTNSRLVSSLNEAERRELLRRVTARKLALHKGGLSLNTKVKHPSPRVTIAPSKEVNELEHQ